MAMLPVKIQSTVIIIGAGPVGLMLANLLGRQAIDTLVLEKEILPRPGSRAIGIMPPSLQILKLLKLDDVFIREAACIEDVFVHGQKRMIGSVSFSQLPSEYKFILSLPQNRIQAILKRNLKKFPCVRVIKEKAFASLGFNPDHIITEVQDVKTGRSEYYSCRFLCACDGSHSAVRQYLRIPYYGTKYKDTFLMADFKDGSELAGQAHLFFTPVGAVESFPLPRGKRRWIVQTECLMPEAPADMIKTAVYGRTGMDISSSPKLGQSAFGVEHFRIKTYTHRGRIFFCGDSAHSMSPIGGQGMNTGFADARLLADLLKEIILGNKEGKRLLSLYEHCRKKAAEHAARRAWLSMRIGTIKGKHFSRLRSAVIFLLIKILGRRIPPYFAMLTIPNCRFSENRKQGRVTF